MVVAVAFWATPALRAWLTAELSHVPSLVRPAVEWVINVAIEISLSSLKAFDWMAHPLGHAIWGPMTTVWGWMAAGVDALANVKDWAVGTWNALGADFNALSSYAQQVYHDAINFAQSVYDNLSNAITTDYNSAINFAQSVYNSATSFTQSVYDTLSAAITADYNSAINFAQGVWNTATQYTTDVFNRVESDIQGAAGVAAAATASALVTAEGQVTALSDYLNAWVPHVAGDLINTALDDLIKGVDGAIAQPWDVAAGAVGGFVDHIPADIAGVLGLPGSLAIPGVASIPAVIGAVAAAVAATAVEVERCLPNLCDGLGKVADLLKLLNTLEWLALLAAVLGSALADPEGLAREAESVLVGPAESLMNGIIDLIKAA
jgi:hypothetical protein